MQLILIDKEIVFADKAFVYSKCFFRADLHLLLGEAMDPEPLDNAVREKFGQV